MCVVRPFQELFIFIAIPLLGFAEKPVVIPFDLRQVIIGKLATYSNNGSFYMSKNAHTLAGIDPVAAVTPLT
jgi:hypothetical protein